MELSVAAGRRRWGWRGLVVGEGAGCSPGGDAGGQNGISTGGSPGVPGGRQEEKTD